MKHYLLFEDVLLLDELNAAEHGLIIDGGQSGDDLHEQGMLGICAMIVAGYDLEDISIEVECIL